MEIETKFNIGDTVFCYFPHQKSIFSWSSDGDDGEEWKGKKATLDNGAYIVSHVRIDLSLNDENGKLDTLIRYQVRSKGHPSFGSVMVHEDYMFSSFKDAQESYLEFTSGASKTN
jgi:hypothetical protein